MTWASLNALCVLRTERNHCSPSERLLGSSSASGVSPHESIQHVGGGAPVGVSPFWYPLQGVLTDPLANAGGWEAVPEQLFFLLSSWTWARMVWVRSLLGRLVEKCYSQLTGRRVRWGPSSTPLTFPRKRIEHRYRTGIAHLDHLDLPVALQGEDQILVFFLGFQENQASQPVLFLLPVFPFRQHFHLLPTAKVPDFNCSWAHKKKTM